MLQWWASLDMKRSCHNGKSSIPGFGIVNLPSSEIVLGNKTKRYPSRPYYRPYAS